MAKTEVISLLIAFFYTIMAISLTSISNYFLTPAPDMATLGASALTNPMGAILAMLSIYFSSFLPLGVGMILLIVLIAVALILALFANEKIALGLIGATKVLLVYLGITLAFVLMIEGSMLKSMSLIGQEVAFPAMGTVILIASIVGFIIFFIAAFVVSKPKSRTIFENN